MPYSNYTKIYDLLNVMAGLGDARDLFEVAETVQAREIESFAIWRPGANEGDPTEKSYCSTASIRRLIRFSAELDLIAIDEDRLCRLTTYGRNATREDRYASTLSTHLANYLRHTAGVSYSEIKDTIAAIRRPDVAFFETIYDRLVSQTDLGITKDRLRMVMYLLERCGRLVSVTKKIYYAPAVEV
jgi:hypothetical protein